MSNESGNNSDARRPTQSEVSWALHQLVVAAAAMDVSLGHRLSLSPVEYQAMKHLMTADNAYGTVELGNLVGLSSGAATGLVDRLENAGHLQRVKDPRDRRRLILEPTDDAVRRTAEQLRPLEQRLNDILADYRADERDVIARFLTETTGAYRSFSGQEPADVDADDANP
ncbi:MarR family transcriptional regulator [Corynebacterium sp. USCH3]|uniref:MarR family winged helix-turn-helix transcriptional regulator n=1 Tax=Corynebacterium sp. USCH3 TaxID=3024840 RepID=UPI003096438B